jgi:hypothetical protein
MRVRAAAAGKASHFRDLPASNFAVGWQPGAAMTLDEKLDEALKETFPASDAFWLAPDAALLQSTEETIVTKCSEPIDRST